MDRTWSRDRKPLHLKMSFVLGKWHFNHVFCAKGLCFVPLEIFLCETVLYLRSKSKIWAQEIDLHFVQDIEVVDKRLLEVNRFLLLLMVQAINVKLLLVIFNPHQHKMNEMLLLVVSKQDIKHIRLENIDHWSTMKLFSCNGWKAIVTTSKEDVNS